MRQKSKIGKTTVSDVGWGGGYVEYLRLFKQRGAAAHPQGDSHHNLHTILQPGSVPSRDTLEKQTRGGPRCVVKGDKSFLVFFKEKG